MEDRETLIERIYEAAAIPEQWPDVLEQLGNSVGALGAVLTTRRSDLWTGFVGSPLIEPGLGNFLMSPRAQLSRATTRVIALNRSGFVRASDVFTPDEWQNDALYTDWVGPTGGGRAVATAIDVPSGEFVVVHLHRKLGEPDFDSRAIDLLDSFRPHLARAGLLAARWRLARLRVATEALAIVGLPALILDRAGKVLAANDLITGATDYVRWLPNDRMALPDPVADSMLRRGLAQLGDAASNSVRSFAARIGPDAQPLVVHLIPTPGQARDIFGGALGVLVITPVNAAAAPDVAVIRGLFDLTATEANVARGVTRGQTIDEIAASSGVDRETVRSQVKSVLAKTGTRRQAEIAALLAGLPKFPSAN